MVNPEMTKLFCYHFVIAIHTNGKKAVLGDFSVEKIKDIFVKEKPMLAFLFHELN